MTKKDLRSFLSKKLKELKEPEKSYLQEEIKSFSTNPEWDKVVKLYNQKKTLEKNPENVLALYLLELAPYPGKLQHRWELSDLCDIDIDYSPDGRDKIKAYLEKKYGKENCVSIGTYGTLGVKGSVQEVSRAFGIKPTEYLSVSKIVSDDDKDLDVDEIRTKYPQVKDFLEKHPEVAEVLVKLTGMKKNIGQHAGGFVVSSDNVYDHIPIVKANKGDVTGWQESGAVKELEALGFIKVDILGLDCVEQIRLCVEEINRKYPNNNLPKDIYLLPLDDPKVYDFINTLQLDNVFQMESKVFVEAVRRIKPRSLQDISNISTLIRPGAAEVDNYVKAKIDRREPKCLHRVYDHTRGLMIYQEQLMQVLMELGGFTIFEADKVRRLVRKIGKSKTSDENRQVMIDESEKYHTKYLNAAIKKISEEDGWPEAEAKNYAEAQWKQLMLQAKYAFNMPHSYAYSLMGYVQAYLKCYYPLEFWTATLNTIDRGVEKHGQSSLGKYINSIYNAGLEVLPPDVNRSEFMFESTLDGKIPFALSYIKDVASGADEVIKNKPYRDWDDFLEKSVKYKFNKRVVRGLIFSGALDFNDNMEDRPYKWLIYLANKGTKRSKSGNRIDKNVQKEIEEMQSNMPEVYNLIEMEYDYCKFSFTGIDKYLKTRPDLKTLQTVSEREKQKKLWVLAGYISDISKKKSKKSGSEYVLVTITDFRDSVSVFGFGDKYKNKILSTFHKGQLIKACIKNDSEWLKFPWESEIGGKFPIQVIS